jgi:amidase
MASTLSHRVGPAASGLAGLGAAALAALVRSGHVTAVDVARAHLTRVAAAEPQNGPFSTIDPERVLAEATSVDTRPNRFALPLAGVPVAVTDDVAVAGFPDPGRSTTARRDDDLVKRLRAAGAIVIGRTGTAEPGLYGAGPGSGADAVAAGMAALALGTDGSGGVRECAARRGLVALTAGRGVVPLPGAARRTWFGPAEVGQIGRTAGDVAMMFEALSGSAVGDLAAVGIPRRVAVSLRGPSRRRRPGPAQRDALAKAARRFAEQGIHTVDADPPYPAGLVREWTRCRQAGLAHDAETLGLDLARLDRATAAAVRRGRRVLRAGPPPEGDGTDGPATAWRDRMAGWLDGGRYDVLMLPAVGPAAERGSRARPARRISYTRTWNLAGLPAAVVPVRWGATQVPVQLVGRPGSEALLLATAACLEREVPVRAGAAKGR